MENTCEKLGDRYFYHQISKMGNGKPNYSPMGRQMDPYFHSSTGMKYMQFAPDNSECAYADDGRMEYTKYFFRGKKRDCDPYNILFKVTGEFD
jgi:hypothetical protein